VAAHRVFAPISLAAEGRKPAKSRGCRECLERLFANTAFKRSDSLNAAFDFCDTSADDP
jgi:hypothetical protein